MKNRQDDFIVTVKNWNFYKCLMLMLEHASAMIEKKLAKKLKVFRITDIYVVYRIYPCMMRACV